MRVFLEASLDKAVSSPRFLVTHATSPCYALNRCKCLVAALFYCKSLTCF